MARQLTLLLTDIVGSTALNTAIGDAAMAKLWEQHDRLSRALIRDWRGKEIGRSDGFLVAFENVDDAASFAMAYHHTLDRFDVPLRARVGIHFGDVTLRQNLAEDTASGATVYEIDGLALSVAARVAAVAGARQTLLSDSAKTQLGLAALRVLSHGHWQLKGLAEPIEVFEVGDERSSFVRPEDGEKAYQVVLERDTWRPLREIRNSIPAAYDDFIGRDADLRRLFDLVTAGARLVSIVGIGGVGKTRVATHFARRWLGEFVGGAWFCDLAQARDMDGIVSAVASGLDVPLKRADPRRQLADVIRGRGRCLIVLDNLEQVTPLVAEIVSYWLDRAPDVRFIATSRERLGLVGEHMLQLEPLDASDAATLFLSRSRASHPNVQFAEEDAKAVGKLVRLLDCLPLAIELAVGRLGVMSPRTMLSRVGDRFALLSARSGRSRRQSTLRAAFDWSWDLLTANERALLAQASVFSGGFTLEAAESVLRLKQPGDDGSVVNTLQSLVDKSFIRVDRARFSLLVSVLEYAAEKLSGSAELREGEVNQREVERRHGLCFAQPVEDEAMRGAAELDNILAACRRAITRKDADVAARAAANAWWILEARGPYKLGIELIDSVLAMEGLQELDRVHLMFIHGRYLLVSGDARARSRLTLAHGRAKDAGARLQELRALASLAELDLVEGNVDDARQQYEAAVTGAAQLGQPGLQCAALNGLGFYFNRLGQSEEARVHFQKALDVARTAKRRRWEGGALSNLGNVEANLGNRAAAKRYYDQAIEVAKELGDRVWLGDLLCNLGLFKLGEGDTSAASADLASSLALARENGLTLLESVVLCNIGLLNEAEGNVRAAEDAYRGALEVARRRGDKRCEGQFLGYLGLLVARRGETEEGRAYLSEGIAILRKVKDRMSLAIVLCRYAEVSASWGDSTGGACCVEEAVATAAELNVAPGSELAASLDRARAAVGG